MKSRVLQCDIKVKQKELKERMKNNIIFYKDCAISISNSTKQNKRMKSV